MAVEDVFREDSYLRSIETRIERVVGDRGLVPARSIFYPTGGGQPGDRGFLETADGRRIAIRDTTYGEDRETIVLHPEDGVELPGAGESVRLHLDWERRHKLMRMHTALHLLTVVCPFPVTGAAVGEDESRIDFDLPDTDADKTAITEALMQLVEADHPVFARQIAEEELDRNPGLVKSANVKPPRGTGTVRLVCVGDESAVDSQPCGGTHVARTGEIGAVHIGKVEKKGRTNRRFRVRFGPLPE